jgi:hypothetical protein
MINGFCQDLLSMLRGSSPSCWGAYTVGGADGGKELVDH